MQLKAVGQVFLNVAQRAKASMFTPERTLARQVLPEILERTHKGACALNQVLDRADVCRSRFDSITEPLVIGDVELPNFAFISFQGRSSDQALENLDSALAFQDELAKLTSHLIQYSAVFFEAIERNENSVGGKEPGVTYLLRLLKIVERNPRALIDQGALPEHVLELADIFEALSKPLPVEAHAEYFPLEYAAPAYRRFNNENLRRRFYGAAENLRKAVA